MDWLAQWRILQSRIARDYQFWHAENIKTLDMYLMYVNKCTHL